MKELSGLSLHLCPQFMPESVITCFLNFLMITQIIMRRKALLFIFIMVTSAYAVPALTHAQQGNFAVTAPKPPEPTTRNQQDLGAEQNLGLGAGNTTAEIPQAYLGCWQGTATQPESWQQFSGPRLAGWVPSTETICFQRLHGKVDVTYRKKRLDEAVAQGHILNYRSWVFVTASQGNHITLSGGGSWQQYAKTWLFGSRLLTITSAKTDTCILFPDEGTMLVKTSENQSCSGGYGCTGGPFLSMVWRITFRKVSSN